MLKTEQWQVCFSRKVGCHSRFGIPSDITFALGWRVTIASAIANVITIFISIIIRIAIAFTTTIAIASCTHIVLPMVVNIGITTLTYIVITAINTFTSRRLNIIVTINYLR